MLPFNVTNMEVSTVVRDNRNIYERECFMLFAPMVAAKTAAQGAVCLDRLCDLFDTNDKNDVGPITKGIEILENEGSEKLMEILKASRCGKYKLMLKFFETFRDLKPCLYSAPIEDYQKLFGISYKSSRFYALMNRPGIMVAALDTHILAEMREKGIEDVPKSTPGGWKEYERLQNAWLEFVKTNHPGKTPAEVDIATWVRRSGSAFKLPARFA